MADSTAEPKAKGERSLKELYALLATIENVEGQRERAEDVRALIAEKEVR